jgi:diguanylate cyclase (GGDEF)-like protein
MWRPAVGGPAPGDSEIGPRDGRSKRKRHTATRVSGPSDDNQTLADREQTVADVEQTAADSDQTAADSDQAASDSDQAASDSDQAASDLELVRSGDVGTHDTTRDLRDRGSRQRSEAAQERVEAASARDAVALARDRAAAVRDEAAAARDAELETAVALLVADSGAENAPPASEILGGGAADRVWAAEFRARAAADREQAARDREQAARDRLAAQKDREALLQRLASAETDELTGTRTRSAGLADLEHEIARARRTAGLLVTAYIDVVGLKTVNDTQGHAAGDALLQHAVRAIREHLRSYDLIVRMGGDEFLCVMSDATVEIARQRFGAVQAALAADRTDRCEIKFGVAALAPEDGVDELVRRADAELPASRRP